MTSTDTIRRPRGARLAGIAALLVVVVCVAGCRDDGPARVDVSLQDAYAAWQSDDPPLFLDVRTDAEYRQAHIDGSVHIPHTEVAQRIDEIRATGAERIIVYCERGGRSRVAEDALAAAGGFEVEHMAGDMRAWRRAKLPVVRDGG